MGYSPWGHKESDTSERLGRNVHGRDPGGLSDLPKEMAESFTLNITLAKDKRMGRVS